MNRQKRALEHLVEKISSKATITLKGAGKKAKRWKKWSAHYQAVIEGKAPAAQAAQPAQPAKEAAAS